MIAKHYVYRNLHKSCWSVKHKGIVVEHADRKVIVNAQFKVSETGRQRVLRERRKNVHAYVAGTPGVNAHISLALDTGNLGVEVGYNPYRVGSFYRKDTGAVVNSARVVVLEPSGTVIAYDLS